MEGKNASQKKKRLHVRVGMMRGRMIKTLILALTI
jgi:hypothetical protein